jgi:hypothetical protein
VTEEFEVLMGKVGMEHERCPQKSAEWEEVARSSPTLSFEVSAQQEQHASEDAVEGGASPHHDLLVEKTKTAGLVRSGEQKGALLNLKNLFRTRSLADHPSA